MPYSEFSDDKLVWLLHNEDNDSFVEIYNRYWKKLVGLAIYKVNDRSIAEEIVQELFVSLWERRAALMINNLENYLFVALKYLIIAHLKKVRLERNLTDAEGLDIGTLPTETLTAEALRVAIDKAVEQLPAKTQTVFRMSRFDEKSHREIAQSLSLTEKAVEYHITQALKFLRIELSDYLV